MPSGQSEATRHDTTLEIKEQDLLEVPLPPAVPPDTTLRLREDDLLEVFAAPPTPPRSKRHVDRSELPWQPHQPEEHQLDLEILEDEHRCLRAERRRIIKGLVLITAVPVAVVGALMLLATLTPLDQTSEREISTHGALKVVDGESAGEMSIHVSGPAKNLAPKPPKQTGRTRAVRAAKSRRPKPKVDRSARRQQRANQQRREQQRQVHLRLASRAVKIKKWRRVQDHARKALRLAPRDRRARAMKRLADRQLTRHRRRLVLARRATRRRQWSSARTHALLALRFYPREREALTIKRRAERNLRHHRRHLKLAKRAARHRQWSRARARAVRALKIAPRDRRARAIKRLAERNLKRSRSYL
jgi:hypothetical protein